MKLHSSNRSRRTIRDRVLNVYVVCFFLFMLAPIAAVVVVSFNSAAFISFPLQSPTWHWYARILEYRPFISGLWVSVRLAVFSTLAACLLGIPAALALARQRSPLSQTITSLLMAPLAVPAIVLGFSLLYFLGSIHFGVSFLSLWISHTVLVLPFILRTVLAVYRGLSPQYGEAALLLGANHWRVFYHVTLPLIRPGIFAGALFSLLISADDVPVSYFFGSTDSTTLPIVMLSYMEQQFDPSIAAISTVQMLLAFGSLFLVQKLFGLKGIVDV